MTSLRERVRSGMEALVEQLRDDALEADVLRAIEAEAPLLRAEQAVRDAIRRDDFELGLCEAGELTPRGERLSALMRVRAFDSNIEPKGRSLIKASVDLVGLARRTSLHFSFRCTPQKRAGTASGGWYVVYTINVSYDHGAPKRLMAVRIRAPDWVPSPDGSAEQKDVWVSEPRISRLGRMLKVGLNPIEALHFLLLFEYHDEEWDVVNAVLDALVDEEDEGETPDGDGGAE